MRVAGKWAKVRSSGSLFANEAFLSNVASDKMITSTTLWRFPGRRFPLPGRLDRLQRRTLLDLCHHGSSVPRRAKVHGAVRQSGTRRPEGTKVGHGGVFRLPLAALHHPVVVASYGRDRRLLIARRADVSRCCGNRALQETCVPVARNRSSGPTGVGTVDPQPTHAEDLPTLKQF